MVAEWYADGLVGGRMVGGFASGLGTERPKSVRRITKEAGMRNGQV